MASLQTWYITHGVCILTHFAMVIASFVAFASLGSESNDGKFWWAPFGSFGVAAFAIVSNVTVIRTIAFLSKLADSTTTEESRHFKRAMTLYISIMFNIIFPVIDIVFAVFLAKASTVESSGRGQLIADCALSVLAAGAAVATFVMDIMRFRSDRSDNDKLQQAMRHQEEA